MRYFPHFLSLVLYLLFATLPVGAQTDAATFNPGLEVDFDPLWDTLMSRSATQKNWSMAFFSSLDLRTKAQFHSPLGQGENPVCGVYSLTHTESCERVLKDAKAERLHPSLLLQSIKNKGRNPRKLGDIITTALEEGMIKSNNWSPVFCRGEEKEHKIIKLKQAISNGHPVLVRLNKSPEDPYNKEKRPLRYADKKHAMVIVGYDNQVMIAMNSRGEKWGDSGYCYIPKDTFFQIAIDGIMLSMEGRSINDLKQADTPLFLHGETTLNRMENGRWQKVAMDWDSLTQSCIPAQTQGWDLSKDVFQLDINLPKLACIYLLNFKPDTVELLEKFIYEPPGRRLTQAFQLENPSEHLVLLHASVPLIGMNEAVQSLSASKGSIYTRLNGVFGDALISTSDIQRTENPAKFTARATLGGTMFIAPIIIGFQAMTR